MGQKKKVYHALVDGATAGLSGQELFAFVQKECPKTSSKRIVRASLLALSDPDLRDGAILNTIYALAIKHRLDDMSGEDNGDEEVEEAPLIATKHREPKATKPKHKNKGDDQHATNGSR